MKKYILASITILSLLISACGSNTPAEPTVSAEDIQSTAVAAAFTIVAETQAAIPTNTPLPPTDTPSPTPLPTDTPIPLPTIDPATLPTLTFTPIPANTASSAGGDPCNSPLPGNVTGNPTKIRLSNQTKGELVISLYLNPTVFGECGYRGYTLSRNDSTTITDLPQGCYNVGVFVTLPNKSTKAFGYGCINNPDMWTFNIYEESVTLAPP